MTTKTYLIFALLISYISSLSAQNNDSLTQTFKVSENIQYSFKKPKFLDIFRYIPNDLAEFGKFTVQKKNLLWTSLAIGSTAAIIPFDQKLIDNASKIGEGIGWDKDHSSGSEFGHILGIVTGPAGHEKIAQTQLFRSICNDCFYGRIGGRRNGRGFYRRKSYICACFFGDDVSLFHGVTV